MPGYVPIDKLNTILSSKTSGISNNQENSVEKIILMILLMENQILLKN